MRNIAPSLFLVLLVLANWLPQVLPSGRRVGGILGLTCLAAAFPFLIWPVMAPVSKPVEIVIDVPLFALVVWSAILTIKGETHPGRER